MKSICVNEICGNCIKRKQRQRSKNNKLDFKKAQTGKKIYSDISSIEHKTIGAAKFWLMFLNDYVGFKWSYFLKREKELTI